MQNKLNAPTDRPHTNAISLSFRHLLTLIVIGLTIVGAGCSSSPTVRKKNQLQETFQETKEAVVNGDLKTLQKIWIAPDGDPFSMETLSKYYEQGRNELIAKFQNAKLLKKPTVFSPSPEIQKRFPNAKYAGTLRVRNSYGDPRPYQAVYVNGSWRLIQRINLQ